MFQQIEFQKLYALPSRNGIMRPSSVRGNGFKMINMGELFKYSRINNQRMELVELNDIEKENFGIENGDILFARQSLVREGAGKVCIVIDIEKPATFESHLIRVRLNKNIASPLFYYYYYNSATGYGSVQSIVNQVAAAGIRGSELAKIKILLPPLPIQRKIAAILSAYDELIENNNRRIAILEKMAEEIYREWFVRLRFPGHENTKIVKGVPDGWEVKRIGDVIKNYIGGGWGEENHNISHSTGAYVIRGTDIPALRAGKFDLPPFRYHKNSNFDSRAMKPGDIVFEVSGGSKDQLLGRSLLITNGIYNLCKGKVICASFCKMIRPSASSFFLNYFLQAYYQCGAVGTYQIQSTGISNYQFESFVKYQTIILPTSDLLYQFDKAIFPLNSEKDNLAKKNKLLTESRDLLLPRLISGKLDVENLDITFPPGMEEEALNA